MLAAESCGCLKTKLILSSGGRKVWNEKSTEGYEIKMSLSVLCQHERAVSITRGDGVAPHESGDCLNDAASRSNSFSLGGFKGSGDDIGCN